MKQILDSTMGHKGMQKEIRKLFDIDGTYTNLDIRPEMSIGIKPDVTGDSRSMTFFDSESFDVVLFDPPFSFHGGKSCGTGDYSRFYITYGLNIYKSRAELGDYIRDSFKEIYRVLKRDGFCLMKWSESRIKLEFPLSFRGLFKIDRKFDRPSKHFGTKTGTHTWYVWLIK